MRQVETRLVASAQKIVNENGGPEEVGKVLDELYGLSLNQFEKLVSSQLLREKLNTELIQRIKASHILIRTAEDASEEIDHLPVIADLKIK